METYHALITGAVLGACTKVGMTAIPIRDSSNGYTNKILISFNGENTFLLTVEPVDIHPGTVFPNAPQFQNIHEDFN